MPGWPTRLAGRRTDGKPFLGGRQPHPVRQLGEGTRSRTIRIGQDVESRRWPVSRPGYGGTSALSAAWPITSSSWPPRARSYRGYGPIGAVVGATYPGQSAELRAALSHAWLLVPGYGSQGGSA